MKRCDGRTSLSKYEQTHNMMQVWAGKLSELQLPVQNPAGRTDGQTEKKKCSMSCLVAAKNRAPLLCSPKLCESFQSHQWIWTGVIIWKCEIGGQIGDFFGCVTLKFHKWPWRIIGHLYYATLWIQTGVTVRKCPNWEFYLTSVTLTFDLLHGHCFCQW